MIRYYHTVQGTLEEIPHLTKGCWVAVEDPTPEETEYLIDTLGVHPDYIRGAMDRNEISLVKRSGNQSLIVIESPMAEHEDDPETATFYTRPVSFILFDDYVITITQHCSYILSVLAEGDHEDFSTENQTGFVLNTLYILAGRYIYFLRQIESLALESERNLKNATKNEEILKLLNLQKSLVYFSTALAGIKSTLDILQQTRTISLTQRDTALLESTQVEINQAIEEATIYSSILSSMMDAFASIISNNVNTVMKIMASITMVMAIPNMVFGFYGMNVGLPLPYIWAPITITLLLMVLVAIWLYRNNFFTE